MAIYCSFSLLLWKALFFAVSSFNTHAHTHSHCAHMENKIKVGFPHSIHMHTQIHIVLISIRKGLNALINDQL